MSNGSDFRLGADVVASDGKKVGSLVSVIVDEQGFDPRALVVKDEESLVGRLRGDSKLFTTDEVVIPITAVESATHELVRLSMSEPDVLLTRHVVLPMRFISRADDMALFADLDKSDIDELKPFIDGE